MKKLFMGCLALVMLLPAVFVLAQGKGMTDAKMMKCCQEVMGQKQKMKEDMKAQNAQLKERLVNINRAPEDKKMGLMSSFLYLLVEQQAAMDARMSKMDDAMMKHTMQHMQMGKDSMSQCPMMKGMENMDEKSEGDHEENK